MGGLVFLSQGSVMSKASALDLKLCSLQSTLSVTEAIFSAPSVWPLPLNWFQTQEGKRGRFY